MYYLGYIVNTQSMFCVREQTIVVCDEVGEKEEDCSERQDET